jgi:hypothetical protein
MRRHFVLGGKIAQWERHCIAEKLFGATGPAEWLIEKPMLCPAWQRE